MPTNGTSGFWKWVAVTLVAVLLSGLPGYVRLYVGTPSRKEVDLIRDRQDSVLQRLSAIDVRLNDTDQDITSIREMLEDLKDLLNDRR